MRVERHDILKRVQRKTKFFCKVNYNLPVLIECKHCASLMLLRPVCFIVLLNKLSEF
jgi:hypothetical protein